MTGQRFVAVVAHDAVARVRWQATSCERLARDLDLEMRLVGQRVVVLVEGGSSISLGDQGVVVGTFFERGRDRPCRHFDQETRSIIQSSRGEWLMRAFWGDYVAILAGEDGSVDVLRSPLGALPCYTSWSEEALILASDIQLLVKLGCKDIRFNWQGLIEHLALSEIERRTTCLAGIEEVLSGERLTVSVRSLERTSVWSPWQFVSQSVRLEEPVEAARRLRDTVLTTSAAVASSFRRIVLRLSGGLDSSVVAAALAHAGKEVFAVTFVSDDRGGDERRYARQAAGHLGIELIEARRELGAVDVRRSDAAGLPRPAARFFTQASQSIVHSVAAKVGADAIFDGGGGDNLFASLTSVAPVVDCFAMDQRGEFWRMADSLGKLTGTSTPHVVWAAYKRRWSRGPEYRWPIDVGMLSPCAIRVARQANGHPWLSAPRRSLPGSAAHIALIAGAASISQMRGPAMSLCERSPLVCQPVAETCLRIPSWLWNRDGNNRMIARDAFRDFLPAEIAYRRGKGTPDGFVSSLIARNRDLIREMLFEGEMVREGIVDRTELDSALSEPRLSRGQDFVRLMQLVDAEAWIQSWR